MYTFANINGVNCLILTPAEYESQRYRGVSKAWFNMLGECKSVFINSGSCICLAPVYYPEELKELLSNWEKLWLKSKILSMVRRSEIVKALWFIQNKAYVNVDRRELSLFIIDCLNNQEQALGASTILFH